MSRPEQNDNWTRRTSRNYDDADAPEAGTESPFVETYREAMALWRDDSRRAGARLDPERLAARVLEAGGVDAAAPGLSTIRASRRYAAAAVLLIGLGLGGATWLGPQAAGAAPPDPQTLTQAVERDRLDLLADREWDLFRVDGR